MTHSAANWVPLTRAELYKLEPGDPVLLHLREYDSKATECEEWDFVEWRGRFLFLANTEKFPVIVNSDNVGKLKKRSGGRSSSG
jgi:hypothetical protein